MGGDRRQVRRGVLPVAIRGRTGLRDMPPTQWEPLTELLRAHAPLVCFLGALLGGTSVTLLLATLSSQAVIPFHNVFVFAFLGNMASDAFWFMVGNTAIVRRFTTRGSVGKAYRQVHALALRHRSREWLLFVLAKFIYGIRILTVVYFGSRRYPPARFALHDSAAVLAITAAVTVAGWSAGKGVSLFVDILGSAQKMLTFFAAAILVLHLLRKAMARAFAAREF
jgi:membrane protein DedA with SNARE-associated domain